MTSNIKIKKSGADISSIQVIARVEIIQKYGHWAAKCPELKTFGFSKTSKEDAISKLDQAIKNFLKFHIRHETLYKALKSFNWSQSETDLFEGVLSDNPTIPDPYTFELAVA